MHTKPITTRLSVMTIGHMDVLSSSSQQLCIVKMRNQTAYEE